MSEAALADLRARLTDAQIQSGEWKVRMMEQLLGCRDQETFAELLFAGFSEASSEGARDAADFVQRLADRAPGASHRHALGVAARGILEYDRRNREDWDRDLSSTRPA